MAKSFYYRLIVLFLLVFGFSVFILIIVILPAYFLSSVKKELADSKLEIQKSEPVPSLDQKTLVVIKDLNKKLDILEAAEQNQFLVSEKVIKGILSEKLPNIKITDITYENNTKKDDPKAGKKISIQGIAPSREVLLSFRLALESDSLFKQVDLPISNFIKGSDIQFYLSLIPS